MISGICHHRWQRRYQFLKWMTKNKRFEMPTTEYPLHHVTEYSKQPTSTVEDGMIEAKKKEHAKDKTTKKKKKKKKTATAKKSTVQTGIKEDL